MTEYETILLGQIIIDDSVYLKAQLESTDFISKQARTLYNGIEYLLGHGVKPDIINLTETCKTVPAHEVAVLTNATTAANWEWYANKVKREGMKAQLLHLFKQGEETLQGAEPIDVMSNIQSGLDKIATREHKYDIVPVSKAVHEYMETTERRYKNKGQLPGYATGYTELDKAIMGLQNEYLIVVGARPSDGKTALMKELATEIALRKVSTGVITTESSISEFMNRTFAGLAEINSQQLKAGNIDEKQFSKLTEACGKIYEAPLFLYDEPNASLERIKMIVRRMVLYHGAKIVFIDYLQNISHRIAGAPRHEAVAEISGELKALARRYKIPIVVMAQLKRPEAGHARNRKPVMSDLGDSRKIEQDADVILMIWHDRDDGGEVIKETQLIVRKNRDGPIKSINLDFEPWFVRFRNRHEGGRQHELGE